MNIQVGDIVHTEQFPCDELRVIALGTEGGHPVFDFVVTENWADGTGARWDWTDKVTEVVRHASAFDQVAL